MLLDGNASPQGVARKPAGLFADCHDCGRDLESRRFRERGHVDTAARRYVASVIFLEARDLRIVEVKLREKPKATRGKLGVQPARRQRLRNAAHHPLSAPHASKAPDTSTAIHRPLHRPLLPLWLARTLASASCAVFSDARVSRSSTSQRARKAGSDRIAVTMRAPCSGGTCAPQRQGTGEKCQCSASWCTKGCSRPEVPSNP